MPSLHVLIVEDSDDDARLMAAQLETSGMPIEWRRVETESEYLAYLAEPCDLILADYRLPQFSGLEALRLVQESGLDIPFILVSGSVGEDIAVEAMRRGAADYLLKDRLARLSQAAMRAIEQKQARDAQRTAEQALEAQRVRLYGILESLPAHVMLLSTDYQMPYVNGTFRARFGDPEGKRCYELLFDRSAPCETCRSFDALRTHTQETWEWQDSSGRFYTVWVLPFADAQGTQLVLEFMFDITDRKQAESSLVAAEKRFRALIENAPDAITLIGADGTVVYDSPAAPRLLGYDPGELLGKNAFALMHPEDLSRIKTAFFEALQPGGPVAHAEFRYQHKSAGWRWLEASASNLLAEPAVEAIVVNYRDITDRKLAELRLVQELDRVRALGEVQRAMASSFDLSLTLSVLLARTREHLMVDAACVLLLDHATQILTYVAGQGFRTSALQNTRLPVGQGLAGQAALQRRIVHVKDLGHSQRSLLRVPGFQVEQFDTYLGAPLIVKGKVQGVMELFHRGPFEPSDASMDFLNALAGQAAVAIDNASMFAGLQRSNYELSQAYDATIEGWSNALDLRDGATASHTRSVTAATLALAPACGVRADDLVHLRRGAALHDIGKMGISDAILRKPGPLTDEEWQVMKQHPLLAYEMLAPIAYLHAALDIPYCHHEKWDGSGYPRGLQGPEIPLAARVFAVVDVWDALTSDRPYRPAWSQERALAYIREQSGKHFDPRVADAFLANYPSLLQAVAVAQDVSEVVGDPAPNPSV